MSKGLEAIQAERDSQPPRGYTEEHDAQYTDGELIDAAVSYIAAAEGFPEEAMDSWPWDIRLLHINTSASSLAKAGALIAAELDRRFAAGECAESDFGHPFREEMPWTHIVTVDNRNMSLCGIPIDKNQRATLLGVRVTCEKCKELM